MIPAAVIAGVFAIVFLRPALRLSKEGHATRATVEHPCVGETAIGYSYHVGTATYTGTASAASLGGTCASLTTGVSVPVIYLPSDPATSMGAVGLARARREAGLETVALFLLVFLGVAILLISGSPRRPRASV